MEYGICGVCGRETRVRSDGRLWRHGYLTASGPRTCSGSNSMPERVIGDLPAILAEDNPQHEED